MKNAKTKLLSVISRLPRNVLQQPCNKASNTFHGGQVKINWVRALIMIILETVQANVRPALMFLRETWKETSITEPTTGS